MKFIDRSLELDATEVRVVWRASARVVQQHEEGDETIVEEREQPFHIDREAAAAEWLDKECAALRAAHGIPS